MEFINLREEALKVSEIAKCSNSTIKITRNEATVYLYKHSAIVCGSSINSLNSSTDELAKYVNDHPHISKIIFPNCIISRITIYKLKITGFFEKLNRKIRIIMLWNYSGKLMDGFKSTIEENNVRLYNFANRSLLYIIKASDNTMIYCEFGNGITKNAIPPSAVLNYTII